MTKLIEAQDGVLKAIEHLYRENVFPDLISNLLAQVFPKYWEALHTRSELLKGNADILAGPIVGQASGSDRPKLMARDVFDIPAVQSSLHEWAKRFRLTSNLSTSGESLPWVLEFGRALCKGERNSVVPVLQAFSSGGLHIPDPKPDEKWSAYRRSGIELLRNHFKSVRSLQRRKNRLHKREPSHYEWFVLQVCGRWTYRNIADRLSLQVGEDTIRKGVDAVCDELGLARK